MVHSYLEQTGIARVLDVTVAASHRPKLELYEASVAIHSQDYVRRMGKKPSDDDKNKDWSPALRVQLGVVKLPNLWYYGVEGGYKFRGVVEGAYWTRDGGYVSVGLGINSTEVLSAFPYAYDAVQLTMSLAGM